MALRGKDGPSSCAPLGKPGTVLCCPRLRGASLGGAGCPSPSPPSPSLPLIAQEVCFGERGKEARVKLLALGFSSSPPSSPPPPAPSPTPPSPAGVGGTFPCPGPSGEEP